MSRRAARRPSGTRRSRSWSARSAAPSRRTRSIATTGKVVELDLVKALRELPDDERGWQTEQRSVQCQSCRAVMVFDPARVGQNCEFCGSPALVDYEEIEGPDPSAGLLPFRVDADRVRDDIRRWWREQVVRARPADSARRSSTRCTASTCRTGRSTRRRTARGTPRRATTTTRPRRSRQQGPTADAPGAARAMGAGVGRRRSLLRR